MTNIPKKRGKKGKNAFCGAKIQKKFDINAEDSKKVYIFAQKYA